MSKFKEVTERINRQKEMFGEHIHFSNPVKPEELEKAYADGMIRKSDLKDRAYYRGTCRNASYAQWFSEYNVFVYMRSKFGSIFPESIFHPEDDDLYDLFIPVGEEPEVDPRWKVEFSNEASFFEYYKNKAK